MTRANSCVGLTILLLVFRLQKSPLQQHTLLERTGWSKLDKVRLLAEGRRDPYPRLFSISGGALRIAVREDSHQPSR